MRKNVIIASLLGGVVIFIWTLFSHAILPIKRSIIHQTFPNQMEVHQVLKEAITEPGMYSCPYLTRAEMANYPDYLNEPIFEIEYLGGTHGEGSNPIQPPLAVVFLGPLLAAWLLSMASDRVLEKYSQRVFYVTLLGLFLALLGDWMPTLWDKQLASLTAFYAINTVLTWFLVGLVIAWRVKPAADR